MANPWNGEIEVDVPGLDRKVVFRLGVNEMIELQAALGLSDNDDAFLSVFDDKKLRSLKTVRAIVFHAIKGKWPEATEAQAGEIVSALGLGKLPGIFREILRWATPEPEPREVGDQPRPSGGPTSSSTRPEPASPRRR